MNSISLGSNKYLEGIYIKELLFSPDIKKSLTIKPRRSPITDSTQLHATSSRPTMAIRVVEFSNGGYKIRKIFAKNQHTQRKLLNFENWVNGEVSKIGHNFRK